MCGGDFFFCAAAGPSFANYYANADPAPLKVYPFYDAKLQVRLERAERLSKRKANKAKKGSIQAPGTKGKGKGEGMISAMRDVCLNDKKKLYIENLNILFSDIVSTGIRSVQRIVVCRVKGSH